MRRLPFECGRESGLLPGGDSLVSRTERRGRPEAAYRRRSLPGGLAGGGGRAAAKAHPNSEQHRWRLDRVRDRFGHHGDRPAAHRLARSRAGTRRPANGEEGDSMPEMGDAEQAIRRLGLGDEDVAAWHDSGLPEAAFTGWLTDRVARRPSGRRAREVYGAEEVHDFARRAILDALAPGPGDHVLEVGCGGGLLLRDAPRHGRQGDRDRPQR
jgi:hypothetical protein